MTWIWHCTDYSLGSKRSFRIRAGHYIRVAPHRQAFGSLEWPATDLLCDQNWSLGTIPRTSKSVRLRKLAPKGRVQHSWSDIPVRAKKTHLQEKLTFRAGFSSADFRSKSGTEMAGKWQSV